MTSFHGTGAVRALKVFGAWTNLVDMKAGNTVDALVEENGKSVVRHYLQDVGSTFGIGTTGPHDYFEGWEYLYDGAPLKKRLLTLGFYIRPWQTAVSESPSVGGFEKPLPSIPCRETCVPCGLLHTRSDDNFGRAPRRGLFR
jgi:hypothetical protein